MKYIKQFINEKLIINKNTKVNKYRYHPKDKEELKELIKKLIDDRGVEADLNDIDTSEITDMSELFRKIKFDGNISKWDVSNVKDMSFMFDKSDFSGKNSDLSNWDVHKVTKMLGMFNSSHFSSKNGKLAYWDVSNVKDMRYMFNGSNFDEDLSNWKINTSNTKWMFLNCPLQKNPPKWYKK